MVEIGDSVRGKDLYIIQTGTKDVNNNIMELLIMAYACKTSSAKNIIGVIPYLPYSKQCKMRKRGCIVSKLLAKMMCKSGLTHVITMDLHQKEIQGFFDCPVDNLRASPFLLQYIQESVSNERIFNFFFFMNLITKLLFTYLFIYFLEQVPDYKNSVIVAKNPGSAKKATSYAERLRVGIAVIHGEQRESESDMNDGRYSPPAVLMSSRTMEVGVGVPVHPAKEKPPINVVGDVSGHIAIMVVRKSSKLKKNILLISGICMIFKHPHFSFLLARSLEIFSVAKGRFVSGRHGWRCSVLRRRCWSPQGTRRHKDLRSCHSRTVKLGRTEAHRRITDRRGNYNYN